MRKMPDLPADALRCVLAHLVRPIERLCDPQMIGEARALLADSLEQHASNRPKHTKSTTKHTQKHKIKKRNEGSEERRQKSAAARRLFSRCEQTFADEPNLHIFYICNI